MGIMRTKQNWYKTHHGFLSINQCTETYRWCVDHIQSKKFRCTMVSPISHFEFQFIIEFQFINEEDCVWFKMLWE